MNANYTHNKAEKEDGLSKFPAVLSSPINVEGSFMEKEKPIMEGRS